MQVNISSRRTIVSDRLQAEVVGVALLGVFRNLLKEQRGRGVEARLVVLGSQLLGLALTAPIV